MVDNEVGGRGGYDLTSPARKSFTVGSAVFRFDGERHRQGLGGWGLTITRTIKGDMRFAGPSMRFLHFDPTVIFRSSVVKSPHSGE